MTRLRRIHPIAGIVGLLVIAAFWTSTVIVELSGNEAAIVLVKRSIPWGFLVLVPALALAGFSGFRLAPAPRDPRLVHKRRRMPVIALNGIFILAPAALYLAHLAGQGEFGTTFRIVQGIELVAGAVNLALMALNVRDGFDLTRGRRKARRRASAASAGPT